MFLIARGTAGVLPHPVKIHKHKNISETITGDRNGIPGLFCFIVIISSLFQVSCRAARRETKRKNQKPSHFILIQLLYQKWVLCSRNMFTTASILENDIQVAEGNFIFVFDFMFDTGGQFGPIKKGPVHRTRFFRHIKLLIDVRYLRMFA